MSLFLPSTVMRSCEISITEEIFYSWCKKKKFLLCTYWNQSPLASLTEISLLTVIFTYRNVKLNPLSYLVLFLTIPSHCERYCTHWKTLTPGIIRQIDISYHFQPYLYWYDFCVKNAWSCYWCFPCNFRMQQQNQVLPWYFYLAFTLM